MTVGDFGDKMDEGGGDLQEDTSFFFGGGVQQLSPEFFFSLCFLSKNSSLAPQEPQGVFSWVP